MMVFSIMVIHFSVFKCTANPKLIRYLRYQFNTHPPPPIPGDHAMYDLSKLRTQNRIGEKIIISREDKSLRNSVLYSLAEKRYISLYFLHSIYFASLDPLH